MEEYASDKRFLCSIWHSLIPYTPQNAELTSRQLRLAQPWTTRSRTWTNATADFSDEAKRDLIEEYSSEKGPGDGVYYRKIRQYQGILGEQQPYLEHRWWARLGASSVREQEETTRTALEALKIRCFRRRYYYSKGQKRLYLKWNIHVD